VSPSTSQEDQEIDSMQIDEREGKVEPEVKDEHKDKDEKKQQTTTHKPDNSDPPPRDNSHLYGKKCDHCTERFDRQDDLEVHMLTTHYYEATIPPKSGTTTEQPKKNATSKVLRNSGPPYYNSGLCQDIAKVPKFPLSRSRVGTHRGIQASLFIGETGDWRFYRQRCSRLFKEPATTLAIESPIESRHSIILRSD
jgi:hypothetical protein